MPAKFPDRRPLPRAYLNVEKVERQLREARQRRRRLAVQYAISANCCSLSAVSAPIFASKYAFCSIFQDLQDYLAEIFEIWQNFANFATFANFLLNFHKNC